jgi:FeS assembly SUF system protein
MFSIFGKRGKKDEADAATPAAPAAVAAPEAPAVSAGPAAAATAVAADPYPEPAAGDPSPWAEAAAGLNLDALLAPTPTTAAATPSQPEVGPADEARTEALKPQIVEALSTIFDPEIPVNIYELGLIYEVFVDANNIVGVKMTLTSPACPSAQQLPSEARYKVKAVEGVADCNVEIVWEPPWTKEMMSETAKLSLGIF